jgi:hypothetical protein
MSEPKAQIDIASKAHARSAEPDPSRRRLLAFGAVGAAAVTCASAPLLASAEADASSVALNTSAYKAIGFHQNLFAYLGQVNRDLWDLEERFPEVAFSPRISLGDCLNLGTGETTPIWANSVEEIDQYFDRRLGGIWAGDQKFLSSTNASRAKAHAEFMEVSRRQSEEAERVGITRHRHVVAQIADQEKRALSDLISLSFSSVEECNAVAKYLFEFAVETADFDGTHPLHRFVASLGGNTIVDEEEDA